jgi:hypothetical protein
MPNCLYGRIQNWLHSPSISVQRKEKYCTSSSRTRVMDKCYFKTVILSGDNNQTWISLSKVFNEGKHVFLVTTRIIHTTHIVHVYDII